MVKSYRALKLWGERERPFCCGAENPTIADTEMHLAQRVGRERERKRSSHVRTALPRKFAESISEITILLGWPMTKKNLIHR